MLNSKEIANRTGTYDILKSARKDEKLFIRVSKEEKEFLQTIADSRGITLSSLIMNTFYTSLNTENNRR